MATPNQIKLIQTGRGDLGWTDQQYRTVLRNMAGVESCKQLDNVGVEDVLAVMEAAGFNNGPGGDATYWQKKVAARGTFANSRMVHKIQQLAGQQKYCLPALCEKFSDRRTQVPDKLRPHEAWNLIEMLKDAVARQAPAAPTLF